MVDYVANARTGLAIYFVVLIILTGLLEWLLLRTGDPIAKHIGLVYLLMWTPAIASLVARLILREGIRDVSFKLQRAFGLKALIIGWLYPVAVGVIAYGLAWLTGLATFSTSGMSFITALAFNLIVGMLYGATSITGEEIGWRGYMLTRLFDAKIPRPVLISGVIWGLWHLPLILSGQYASGPNPTLSVVIFMALIVPTTYLVSWLRLQSGSIWPPIIFHASWNSLIQGVFDQSTKETSIWLGESGILVALVSLALVIFLVRGRWAIKHTPTEETAEQVNAMAV
jgi:membrane protease YdiL (CAAX protease family)